MLSSSQGSPSPRLSPTNIQPALKVTMLRNCTLTDLPHPFPSFDNDIPCLLCLSRTLVPPRTGCCVYRTDENGARLPRCVECEHSRWDCQPVPGERSLEVKMWWAQILKLPPEQGAPMAIHHWGVSLMAWIREHIDTEHSMHPQHDQQAAAPNLAGATCDPMSGQPSLGESSTVAAERQALASECNAATEKQKEIAEYRNAATEERQAAVEELKAHAEQRKADAEHRKAAAEHRKAAAEERIAIAADHIAAAEDRKAAALEKLANLVAREKRQQNI
ncbi:hypothetical protein QBC47DRAFT_386646 [Echria macrotheca]|uniref:Uncharacterized protein n=1 Tax=Echria macrotheca TaxID=438768 RepID=A0AAJ0B896_9PEZI|nr:hypothetical protein QBC47DRAFT_386646 [Echria macrotheca]